MSSIKKTLAMAIVLVMVIGAMVPAFALPADVEGTDYESSAAMLGALNIMVGDAETGNFRPDDAIKRSEFAKLAVLSLGLESAAQAATSYSMFPDVVDNHWALGYINVAAGQGIIVGDDTGNFRPDDTITYAEALTILVRSLGYKDSFLQGNWPANFISKAAELDITDGVNMNTSQAATRGNVALLLVNTLETEVVTQSSFGDDSNWTVSEDTLMESKLDLTKYEEVTIDAVSKVDNSLDANEVKLVGEEITNGTYELASDMETAELLGLEADVFLNNDDKVVHIKVTTEEDDIITGQITAVDVDAENKIKVQFADGSDEEYDVTATTVYVNNADAENDYADLAVGQYGRFMLNEDDEVIFADLYEIADHAIITSINAEKEYVKGINGESDDHKVSFDDEDGYKIFKNGEAITMEDLEEGDLIFITEDVNELDGDVYNYVYVVNNVVSGELTKARDTDLQIKDTEYDIAADMSYSLDNADSINDFTGAVDIENAIGEDVTAYLDLKGDVIYLSTDVQVTSSTLYGVVVKNNEITMDTVKIFNSEGETVTYTLDEDVAPADINEGDIVKFELDADGTIDYEDNYTVLVAGSDVVNNDIVLSSFDDDNDYIIDENGNKIFVADDSVMMEYFDGADVDPAIVNWEDIESKDASNVNAYIVMDEDDINAELVIFTENYDLSGDTKAAYVADDMYYDGDWKVDVVLANGNEDTFVLTSDAKASGIVKGDFVVFNTNQSGEMDSVVRAAYDNSAAADLDSVDANWSIVSGTVTKVSGRVIEVDNNVSYKVLDSANMYALTLDDDNEYDEIDEADMSDVDEDSVVRLILDDEDDIVMVIIVE